MPPSDLDDHDVEEGAEELASELTVAGQEAPPRSLLELANEPTVTRAPESPESLADIPTFDRGEDEPHQFRRQSSISIAALPSTVFDAPPPSGLPETKLVVLDDLVGEAPSIRPAASAPAALRAVSARPGLSGKAIALRASLGAMMALGVLVIAQHFLIGPAPAVVGPLRVVAAPSAAPAAAAPRTVVAIPADLERPLPDLERRAVAHVAAGRLREASQAYAALAERVPHEPAYLAAAHLLAERAQRAAR